MKSKLPVATAKSINEAHQCARESAENAVEWAVKCGQLLAAKKEEVGHGNFMPWVEKNCDFSYASAAVYLRAAKQSSRGLEFSSLNKLLAPPADAALKSKDSPKGAVSVLKPKGTEETGADRPAAPVFDPAPAPNATPKQQPAPELPQKSAENTPAPDFDFSGYEPEDDEAYKQNIENVMMADDKLSAMREELKKVHRELQAVKSSRDHYLSEAGAAARIVKARDREIEKLRKQLERAEAA